MNDQQPHNNGLFHDAQSRWQGILSPTQAPTEEQQQQSETQMTKRKKKYHENQKLQHFKRKCRARGLTEEHIATRIQNRNHTISEPLLTDQTIPEQTHESLKRKRVDLSIQKSFNSSKQLRTMSSNTEGSQINSQNYTLYKPSKYLKMPRTLLLHSLHLQLNCPLKRKKE